MSAGPVGRNKRSALRHKNNGATTIPRSEVHLASMFENGAKRFASYELHGGHAAGRVRVGQLCCSRPRRWN